MFIFYVIWLLIFEFCWQKWLNKNRRFYWKEKSWKYRLLIWIKLNIRDSPYLIGISPFWNNRDYSCILCVRSFCWTASLISLVIDPLFIICWQMAKRANKNKKEVKKQEIIEEKVFELWKMRFLILLGRGNSSERTCCRKRRSKIWRGEETWRSCSCFFRRGTGTRWRWYVLFWFRIRFWIWRGARTNHNKANWRGRRPDRGGKEENQTDWDWYTKMVVVPSRYIEVCDSCIYPHWERETSSNSARLVLISISWTIRVQLNIYKPTSTRRSMLVTTLLANSCSAKKYVYEHMDEDKKKRNIEKANLRKQEW